MRSQGLQNPPPKASTSFAVHHNIRRCTYLSVIRNPIRLAPAKPSKPIHARYQHLVKSSIAGQDSQGQLHNDDEDEEDEDEDVSVEVDDTEQLYTTDWLPPTYYGPIDIKLIKGKGRGLVLGENVGAGELLLVSKPMSIIYGKAGRYLSPTRLTKAVLNYTYQPEDDVWLTLLFDGTDRTANRLFDLHEFDFEIEGDESDSELELEDEPEPESPPSSNTDTSSSSSSSSSSEASSAEGAGGVGVEEEEGEEELVEEVEVIDEGRIQRIVQLNCFGEDYCDPAATTCRGEALSSFVGLWPEFSMLNHSCMPNSCMMVLANTMLVRAAVPLRRGTEATINYAGDLIAAPLTVRQAHLRETFGFTCRCLRCSAESQVNTALSEKVHSTYWEVREKLKPRLLAALEADDDGGVRAVQGDLERLEGEMEQVMREALSGKLPLIEQMLRAGVYQMYELQSMCVDHLGEQPNTDIVAKRLAILKLFATGTYNYAFLAAEYLRRVKADPKAAPASAEASRVCAEAHLARYGRIGTDVFTRLVAAHRDNPLMRDSLLA